MERYRHRQHGWAMRKFLAVIIAIESFVFFGLALAIPEARAAMVWSFLLLLVLITLVLWVFGSLEVSVDPSRVRLAFGPGWPRKEIPTGEIRVAAPVRNSWWWGFGIRLTPRGWMWNVSGLDAVEVELASGKAFRIGTDEPHPLCAAIRGAAGLESDESGSTDSGKAPPIEPV